MVWSWLFLSCIEMKRITDIWLNWKSIQLNFISSDQEIFIKEKRKLILASKWPCRYIKYLYILNKIYFHKSLEERDRNTVFIIPIIDLKDIHLNYSYTSYCKYLEKGSCLEFAFQSVLPHGRIIVMPSLSSCSTHWPPTSHLSS